MTSCILFSERWLSWITDVHKDLYKEQEVSSSSKADKSRSLFKGSDTSIKHPNTTITKLYSSNNSLTLISLCSLEWLGWFRCMSSRARCSIVKETLLMNTCRVRGRDNFASNFILDNSDLAAKLLIDDDQQVQRRHLLLSAVLWS